MQTPNIETSRLAVALYEYIRDSAKHQSTEQQFKMARQINARIADLQQLQAEAHELPHIDVHEPFNESYVVDVEVEVTLRVSFQIGSDRFDDNVNPGTLAPMDIDSALYESDIEDAVADGNFSYFTYDVVAYDVDYHIDL